MRCCVKCFEEPYLIDLISAEGRKGNCEFCSSKNIKTLEAGELNNAFEQLLGLYEPAEPGTHYIVDSEGEYQYEGASLAERINSEDGWGVFSEDLDIEKQNQLLDSNSVDLAVRCAWRPPPWEHWLLAHL